MAVISDGCSGASRVGRDATGGHNPHSRRTDAHASQEDRNFDAGDGN
jgi:hypothetical protein